MTDQASVERMLAEALDDFDEDSPPPSMPSPPPTDAFPKPVTPPPLAAGSRSATATSALDNYSDQQVDELAKILMENLRELEPTSAGGSSNGEDALDETLRKLSASAQAEATRPAAATRPGANATAAAASDGDQMEQALQRLAASAESLAQDGSSDEAAGDEAMLQLLKQLGGLGDGGAPGAGVPPADADVLKLLQQLGGGVGGGGGVGPDPAATKGGSSGSSGGSSSGGNGSAGGEPDDDAFSGMLDKLVGQLLSKDVMLEPMRHLHAEFPRYLAAHREELGPEELGRYTKQQALVGQILASYQEAPDDTERVATLMQQMQQYGPPPSEIAGPVADGAGCVLC